MSTNQGQMAPIVQDKERVIDVIEAAESVVERYTTRRLNAALHSQTVCGCRACVARARGWIDWAAGDDDAGNG